LAERAPHPEDDTPSPDAVFNWPSHVSEKTKLAHRARPMA
jgi:hypothetical protein